MFKMQWEPIPQDIAGTLWRAKVPGGWLVNMVNDVTQILPDQGLTQGYDWRSSLTFLPDPSHLWGMDTMVSVHAAGRDGNGNFYGEFKDGRMGSLFIEGREYKVYMADDEPCEIKLPHCHDGIVKHKFTLIEM